jgi:hypothetical protein
VQSPEPRVLEWMDAIDGDLLYLSVLTLARFVRASPNSHRPNEGPIWKHGWRLTSKLVSRVESCRSIFRLPTVGVCWQRNRNGRGKLYQLSKDC